MASDMERLVVSLEARTKAFDNQMKKSADATQRQLTRIEKQFADANKKLVLKPPVVQGAGMTGMFGKLGAGLGVGLAAREFTQFADASTRVTNGLKVAGLEGKNLSDTYARLGKIALDNGAGFEAIAGLYAKVTAASKDLGVSSSEVEEFTRRMAVGLKASGTDAGAASAGIMQLNQALASGVLRGDEFNSVAENLPVVAKAIADGFGVTVGKLREMAAEGELTASKVFAAFMKGSAGLDAQAAKTATTFSQSWENIKTAMTIAVGAFNESTGASQAFADAVNNFVVPAIVGLGDAIATTNKKHSALAKDLQGFAQATGIEQGVINATNALQNLGREADPLVAAFKSAGDSVRSARADLSSSFSGIADDFATTMQALQEAGQGEIASGLSGAFVGLTQKIADGSIAAKDFDSVIGRLRETGDAMASNLASSIEIIRDRFASAGKAAEKSFEDAGKALAYALGAKAIATVDALAAKFGSAMPDAVGKFTSALREAVGLLATMDASTAAVVGQLQNFSAFRLGELNMGPSAGFLNFGDLSKERDLSAAGESIAAGMIKKLEGFRANAYWDVNAYRAGFGSDTTTDVSGKVSKITADSVVSLADANRDLARRLVEFQASITSAIGADTWASFTEEQQAALESITYNYGELPDRIVAAIKSGSPEQIGTAIRNLGDDNGGVNRSRRAEEANMFFSGSGNGDTPDEVLAKRKDAWEGLREVTGKAAAAVDANAAAYEKLGDIAGTAIDGIISALEDGKVTGTEMLQILLNVGKQLLALPTPGGSGGNLLTSLLGGLLGGGGAPTTGLFADGGVAAHGQRRPLPRFAGGGVSRSAAIFGEAGPEAAVPLPDGRRIPVDLRIPRIQTPAIPQRPQAAAAASAVIRIDIGNARGNTEVMEMVRAGVQQGLTQYDKLAKRTFPQRMAEAQIRDF